MSNPVVQSQTADQKMREELQQQAFAQDRMRRASELARMEEVRASRDADRQATLSAPIGVSLGHQVVRRETWTGSIEVLKTGAGVCSLLIEGVCVDALDVPDYLIKLADKAKEADAPTTKAEGEKPTQGFRSRVPKGGSNG